MRILIILVKENVQYYFLNRLWKSGLNMNEGGKLSLFIMKCNHLYTLNVGFVLSSSDVCEWMCLGCLSLSLSHTQVLPRPIHSQTKALRLISATTHYFSATDLFYSYFLG